MGRAVEDSTKNRGKAKSVGAFNAAALFGESNPTDLPISSG